MKVTKNGIANSHIILPENPTKREKFAADELVYYIEKISGVLLADDHEFENRIIIGGPSRNKAAAEFISAEEFNIKVPGPEGFIILINEDAILLAGCECGGDYERGTVYAVYEFLERFLGCSLSAFSNSDIEAGEFIPKIKDIDIGEAVYIKEKADLSYRTAIVQYDVWVGNPDHPLNDRFISWLGKNRYNRILTWTGVYEGFKKNGMLEEAEKRGIMFSVGHHEAINMLLPPEGNEYFEKHYAKVHPEYYKLLPDGSRYKVNNGDFKGQLILCMRNIELIDEISNNIIKWSDENPQADVICLWPHDGCHEQCVCDKCKKYSKSANYAYFVNEIAKRVIKVKPCLKIDKIAYIDILECDVDNISSSVIIDEAVWFDTGLRKIGKPDGSCLSKTQYEEVLLKWKNAGAEVVYYDYLMGIYGCRQRWMPASDEMQAICTRFCEKGISGLGTQLEAFNMWNHIFNFYSYARCAYDISLSFDDNLKRFCRIFGEGAKYIEEIIKYGEEILDGNVTIDKASQYLMENINKERVYSLFEKALEASSDKAARNNIRLMRMVFRYSDLELNNPRYTTERTGIISDAADESGELWYMHENFDSFKSGKEGYAIAIPVSKTTSNKFSPDKWYIFD